MPRSSKKSVFSRFFSKALDRRINESSLQDDDEYVQEGTQRAMAISRDPGEFSPPLTDAELEAIPLPGELISEEWHRNRDNSTAKAAFVAKKDEIQALIERSQEIISEARDSTIDLSKFLKKDKTRGQAALYTKLDKQGRRVILEWDPNGRPIGPGAWANKFTEAIGCLIRNKDIWDVAFNFNSNPFSAFKNTWMELLRSFVLENDVDMHWKFVRKKMNESFRQHRENLKQKYLKPPFEEHWQRIYGVPSTVPIESFAFLLLYWDSEEAQAESARNSINRRKNADQYFGGSVSIPTWRHNVAAAGGDASLSNTWQVLHTTEGMPTEIQDIQRAHCENLYASEQLFREENPEYPVDNSILPLAVEANMLQKEFPNSAAKGRLPLIGAPLRMAKRGRTTYSNEYYSSQDRKRIKELEETVAEMKQMFQQQQQLVERVVSQLGSQQQTSQYQSTAQGSFYPPSVQATAPPPQASQEYQINMSLEEYEEFQRLRASRRSGGQY